jgi:hypothetical protein
MAAGIAQLWLVYGGMGAAFCWLYRRTGTLWAAITAHALNNAVALAALVFPGVNVTPRPLDERLSRYATHSAYEHGGDHETTAAGPVITTVSACATTTSPTGRRQMVGGVSQGSSWTSSARRRSPKPSEGKDQHRGRQNAYVQCVVNALVAQLPPSTVAYGGRRRCSSTRNPTPSPCPAARSA